VCRTPMQWDAGPNAGFTSAVEPWLPVSGDYLTRNVAAQSADPHSILSFYRRLVWYRRATPALYGGDYCSLDAGNDRCFVYLRSSQGGDQRRLVALNLASEESIITIPGHSAGRIALSTYLDREGIESLSGLRLRPNEGVIVEL
jgi:alpha-glucosidase